jgi:hypothetical protein
MNIPNLEKPTESHTRKLDHHARKNWDSGRAGWAGPPDQQPELGG